MWRTLNPEWDYETKQAREKFEADFLNDVHPVLEKIASTYENLEGYTDYQFTIAFVSVVYNAIYDRIYGDK